MEEKATPKGIVIGKKCNARYIKPLAYGIVYALFGIAMIILTSVVRFDVLILVAGCFFTVTGLCFTAYAAWVMRLPIDAVTIDDNGIYIRRLFDYAYLRFIEIADVLELPTKTEKKTDRYGIVFFSVGDKKITTLCVSNASKVYEDVVNSIPQIKAREAYFKNYNL